MSLKPQDLVVLVALFVRGDEPWTYEQVSQEVGLSVSQVHRSVQRASSSGLYASGPRRVLVRNLLEFLVHGVQYVFPASFGPRQRGVVTSVSAPPLREHMAGDGLVVWPAADGTELGDALEPLHPSAVHLSRRVPAAHELLALVDAIRGGRAREKRLATELLEERLCRRAA